MVQFGEFICAADKQVYKLINKTTGITVPIFPYDGSIMSPALIVIGKGEFLLVTASTVGVGLGVFVSDAGEPIRGTWQWSGIPIQLGNHSFQITIIDFF